MHNAGKPTITSCPIRTDFNPPTKKVADVVAGPRGGWVGENRCEQSEGQDRMRPRLNTASSKTTIGYWLGQSQPANTCVPHIGHTKYKGNTGMTLQLLAHGDPSIQEATTPYYEIISQHLNYVICSYNNT